MDSEIPDNIYPDSNIVISTHTDFTRSHYPKRIKAFKENPLNVNEIVFLGNSITEQGGDWGIRVNNSKARNRGISGDTTEGVLGRLAEIIYFKPKNVFILIGINDLFRDDMTASMVFNNILSIVNQIHDGSAETKIYVQTILPTTTSNIKEKIQLTNQMLDKSESDQPYELIQLYTHFVTEENAMNMEMSVDGVHLNENGYNLWVKNIKNLIDK
ncbi:SGNH/GDSL hydrolase family protein [Flaviramulus aquimarinus]|uniref:SGNH/GDSL hydrolase family protein n=2 Tax=Flaviramulus aquimarinus TaxID=1170456 RepID=A0ABP9F8T4_9FLAO